MSNVAPLYENFEDRKSSNISRIKAMIAEGKPTDEIAAALNVKPNSLRVYCSRHGISLRPLPAPVPVEADAKPPRRRRHANSDFQVSLRITYRGKAKTIDLALPVEAVAMLALEAEVTSTSTGDLLGKMLAAIIKGRKP
jgi:hypothetical protein